MQRSRAELLELFPCWCHFLGDLSAGQGGPNGKYAMLILYGHASRWSFEGLQYLSDKFLYCLPSQTSIHSQVIAKHNRENFICQSTFKLTQPIGNLISLDSRTTLE
jgi:hypothetical protein